MEIIKDWYNDSKHRIGAEYDKALIIEPILTLFESTSSNLEISWKYIYGIEYKGLYINIQKTTKIHEL